MEVQPKILTNEIICDLGFASKLYWRKEGRWGLDKLGLNMSDR